MWRTGQGDAVDDELKVGAAQANTKGQAASILRVVVPQLSHARTSRPRLRVWQPRRHDGAQAQVRSGGPLLAGLRSVFLRAASARSRAMDSSSISAEYQPNSAASSARRRLSWSLVGGYSSSALGVAAQLSMPGETPRITQRARRHPKGSDTPWRGRPLTSILRTGRCWLRLGCGLACVVSLFGM